MRERPHIAPLPADHPALPNQPLRLESDKTRPAVDRVRETLAVGINIQATGEVTNTVVTGMVKCLLDHIDELEADLNCAVAVGRMAAGALKPLLAQPNREKLQATYNDLLALQDQTDQVPLATALDAVGIALAALPSS